MNYISEKFPKEERIRKRKDFERIFEKGTKKRSKNLTLIRIASADPVRKKLSNGADRRIGFVLNRHIKPVVTRNKLKRRLRDIYRKNKSSFKGENLILVHPGAQELSFSELKDEVLNLCKLVDK